MEPAARIIKGGAPVPAHRIEAAVFDADRKVREMVAAAEERARTIVEVAEAERARALAEGRAEGRREGEALAAALILRAVAERDRLLSGAPRAVARLALEVARKVLGRAIGEPEGVVALAEAAVAAARGRRDVVVRVSLEDAATVRAGEGRLAAALGRAAVEVRADAGLARGAVVVETEAGRIEGGIEAQLDVLARALEDALA